MKCRKAEEQRLRAVRALVRETAGEQAEDALMNLYEEAETEAEADVQEAEPTMVQALERMRESPDGREWLNGHPDATWEDIIRHTGAGR